MEKYQIKELNLPVQIFLTGLSAAVIPLCFPPFGWWPLLVVSFFALFIVIRNTFPRCACYLGMLHGCIGYGLSLYWLYYITLWTAIEFYRSELLRIALLPIASAEIAADDFHPSRLAFSLGGACRSINCFVICLHGKESSVNIKRGV